MPPWFNATVAWLRRQVAWSNSRRSWQERLGVLALTVTLILGWYVSRSWAVEQRVVLFCAWLLLFALLVRRGLIKLFGPVFFFEALRGTRRRIHLYRTLYALAIFAAVGWVWIAHWDGNAGGRSEIREQAQFAQTVFLVFFTVQMLAILFFTPIAVASAIAEEKERRTLEFMLATDLRSREILFGKLAGRMANMTLYLLAGLPILALLQVMGGIDPDLMLASIAGAVVTFVSLAALSVLMSVLQRRSRDAIVLTFLAIFAYHGLSAALYALLKIPGVDRWSVAVGGTAFTSLDAVNFANAGNLIVQLLDVVDAVQFGGVGLHEVIGDILRQYAIFHAVVIVVCLIWATLRLRPVAKAQMAGGERRSAHAKRKHPPIGLRPMMWKEIFAETYRMHWLQKVILALIVVVGFVPPVWITVVNFNELVTSVPTLWSSSSMRGQRWSDPWFRFGTEMNIWVRVLSGIAGTMLLMAVAVRAAGSISSERGKQTFDELLATPLTNQEIVIGKWAGAILSVRRGWIWLGLVYLVGVLSGGLNPVGALAAAAAWLIFAVVFAEIGLWFSIHARSTFRATTYTVLTTLFLLGFHWLLFLFCCVLPVWSIGDPGPHAVEWIGAAQLGLTPPVTLGLCPIMEFAEFKNLGNYGTRVVTCQFLGVGTYLLVGIVLVPALCRRFALQFSRTDIRHPESRVRPPTAGATETKT